MHLITVRLVSCQSKRLNKMNIVRKHWFVEFVEIQKPPVIKKFAPLVLVKRINSGLLSKRPGMKRLKQLILVFWGNQRHKSRKKSLSSHTLNLMTMLRPETLCFCWSQTLQLLVVLLPTNFNKDSKTFNMAKSERKVKIEQTRQVMKLSLMMS